MRNNSSGKMFILVSVVSVFLIKVRISTASGKHLHPEPQITCVSQFDYDYKTLTKVVETEHAMKKMKESVEDQEQKTRELTEKIARLDNQHVVNVAFTAKITHEALTGLKPGDILVFNHAITNLGNGYDVNLGIFEAPVRGLYVFSMDIMVRAGQRQYAQFEVNGVSKLSNFAMATDAKHYVSSSRTLTTLLSAGDKVWIRIPNKSTHGDGVVHGNGFSTFSGWLQTPIP